jgi:tripeptide aminopeptidase
MIDQQRLSREFARLAAINSPPLHESSIASYLAERLQRLGAEIRFDAAATATGGEVGNLVASFPGNGKQAEPLLFSVHMDTVEPGGQVEPVLRDGVFYSAGDTILGADDKAGIAELIEALEVVNEQDILHGPIEVVVTIAEEIGLVGAKHFDYNMVQARYGYALDTEGVDMMVLQAPGANHIQIEIEGLASHAGMVPERGVEGGVARNIVPQKVSIVGEARSHDPVKLQEQTEHMLSCFEAAADEMTREIDGMRVRPEIHVEVRPDFPSMSVDEKAPVVTLARNAAEALGQDLKIRLGGGGSDANIFNGHGIEMIIHVTELLVEIIRQA